MIDRGVSFFFFGWRLGLGDGGSRLKVKRGGNVSAHLRSCWPWFAVLFFHLFLFSFIALLVL